MPSSIIVGYVQLKEVGLFVPYPWAAPKRLVLNRVKACNFSKNRLQRCCFPINIPKFLRTSILKNISERLLLNRIWKRCRKYPYEWLKKDLAAQEVAFKFFSLTFYEISVLCNTAIALTCSKFVKYFRFSHVFVTLLLKRISPVKSKHIKEKTKKVILLNDIF